MQLDSKRTGLIAASMIGTLSMALNGCATTPSEGTTKAGQHITAPPSKDGTDGGDKPSDPPNGGDTGACTPLPIGDGSTCIDPSSLKQAALDACSAQGNQVLVDLYAANDCPDGGSTVAKALCCESTPSPPNDGSCKPQVLGDGATCVDATTIKQTAIDTCTALGGLVLTDLTLAEDCPDGGSTAAKILCCAVPPPPSNGDSCKVLPVGDGVSCQDPGTLKQASLDLCNQAALTLVDLTLAQDCPDGGSTAAKAVCCAP